ncbi:hypothetical protein F2Q70_00004274 [Brassica cretica]|uniref:Uncharacterized protein n=1 Tax=Brassica cretica TaxID=69181 RepID=A0A8S9J3T7_BRACR|nr:hypothetical protein F2Q70_00004274 [Brassica cretica]
MRKFDALSEHIKRLDSQVAENATAIKRETGRLPWQTDANPKRQVNAVLLISGKRLISSAIEINNAEKHALVEEAGKNRSRPIILDDPSTESGTPREKEQPNTEKGAMNLEEEEGELEEDVEIDRQERTNVDRQATVNVDRHSGNNVDRLSTPGEPAIERVYRTLPPFPPDKTQTKRELDKVICKKAFDKITLEMPLSDAIKNVSIDIPMGVSIDTPFAPPIDYSMKSLISSSPLRHLSFIAAVVFSILCNLSPRLSRLN